jgi:glutathione S-transferase
LSPLRRIPVLIDDRDAHGFVGDPSVPEDRWPEPALYPRDAADRARARWLEEFADTRMGDVFIWRSSTSSSSASSWGEPTDDAVVQKTLPRTPAVLDYLRRRRRRTASSSARSIADVAVAFLPERRLGTLQDRRGALADRGSSTGRSGRTGSRPCARSRTRRCARRRPSSARRCSRSALRSRKSPAVRRPRRGVMSV